MVDLQSHKLQLHPSKNIAPTYDATNGNNGTNLIVKHNSLVDAIQTEVTTLFNDLSVSNSNINLLTNEIHGILDYPISVPSLEWNTSTIYFDINSSTGVDSENSPTLKTIAYACQALALGKINYNNTLIVFRLSGNFNETIDLSNVIIDITKNQDGSPYNEIDDICVSFRITNSDGISTRNWTLTSIANPNNFDNFILPPKFKIKKLNQINIFDISLFSGNLIADLVPFIIDKFPISIITKLHIYGCSITDTANNGWTEFYINNIHTFEVQTDFSNSNLGVEFTTNNYQWCAIELNGVNKIILLGSGNNITFSNYDEAIYFDSDPAETLQIAGVVFQNTQSNDIFLNDGIRRIPGLSATFSKGINSNSIIQIPFFFTSMPQGYVYLTEPISRYYTVDKVIIRCGTGSFTCAFRLNGSIVQLYHDDTGSVNTITANTTKRRYNVMTQRPAIPDTYDIALSAVSGTATNVSIILIVTAMV